MVNDLFAGIVFLYGFIAIPFVLISLNAGRRAPDDHERCEW